MAARYIQNKRHAASDGYPRSGLTTAMSSYPRVATTWHASAERGIRPDIVA